MRRQPPGLLSESARILRPEHMFDMSRYWLLAGDHVGTARAVEILILHAIPAGSPDGDEARRLRSDVIAVGTAGRAGAERWIFGSVAEGVIGDAIADVLVVRRG